MVKSFQFSRLPKIYFKNGILSDLPVIARPFGKRVVVVTGKRSFADSPHAQKLFNNFEKADIGFQLINIPGEPTPEIIDLNVKKLLKEKVDLIIAIGGGSVLDAGKALSAMMYHSESVVEYLEGVGDKEHPGTKLPFIAVPTTSGTGSEATKNAVISKIGRNGFKKSLRHENFVPDIAVVDPELTLNCPQEITAASGMDCFTQLTEAYLSDKSNEYTDALSIAGLKAIKDSLEITYTNGEDVEARAGMSFAALTSGICLANAGLGVVHGFASSIGGRYNIPHGLVCGTLMAISNEIIIRELRKRSSNPGALKKYAFMGELFLDEKSKTDNYYIDGFISYLHELTQNFKLSGLGKYGVKEKDVESVCKMTEMKNNPVKLAPEELAEIVTKRL